MKEYIKTYLNEIMNVSIISAPRTEKFKLKKIVVRHPSGKTYTYENEDEARQMHGVTGWEAIKAGKTKYTVDLNNKKEYKEDL